VKSRPTIIADDKIPFVWEAFQPLGDLLVLPGREMNAITIRDADILIVRSITRVDELLLGKSKVKYVATASTGYDHVDTDYLTERGIHFFSALGCNANAVSEYIIVTIAVLCRRYNLNFEDLTIGIVGAGQIGSRVNKKAASLGMNTLLNDPPLKDETEDDVYRPLNEVLSQSDIVTLHVPLTDQKPYLTRKMVNSDFLKMMKHESFLINTSRGAIVDEAVLQDKLSNKQIAGAVLDVWYNEPAINTDLLKKVDIGTPHIAGHSVDGKVNATVMVYRDVCKYLAVESTWEPAGLPEPGNPEISIHNSDILQDAIIDALLYAFPVENDDARLRQIVNIKQDEKPVFFDMVRNEHLKRREFDSYYVRGGDDKVIEILTKLGFNKK